MSGRKPVSISREPPPSLFMHPSPDASHVSLPGALPANASVHVGDSSRFRSRKQVNDNHPPMRHRLSSDLDAQRIGRGLEHLERGRSVDRIDALWAEMQTKLEEVELSASGGTHVFGPDHDQRLAELRFAQIALAQAWARNEADVAFDSENSTDGRPNMKASKPTLAERTPSTGRTNDVTKKTALENTAITKTTGTSDVGQLDLNLEKETESDIYLARKRREANDIYFRRVNAGVRDVVTKLEKVAVAMRAVEKVSKDVWDDEKAPSA